MCVQVYVVKCEMKICCIGPRTEHVSVLEIVLHLISHKYLIANCFGWLFADLRIIKNWQLSLLQNGNEVQIKTHIIQRKKGLHSMNSLDFRLAQRFFNILYVPRLKNKDTNDKMKKKKKTDLEIVYPFPQNIRQLMTENNWIQVETVYLHVIQPVLIARRFLFSNAITRIRHPKKRPERYLNFCVVLHGNCIEYNNSNNKKK